MKKPKMEPRRASIWGSTNKAEFLTDATGSVRWLCFTVVDIDWSYKSQIDIDRVWSQAYQLFKSGFKYEMTTQEILQNEFANNQYKTITAEVELVQKFYSPGTRENHDRFLTATDFCQHLMANGNANLRINAMEIGKALKLLGHEQSRREVAKTSPSPKKDIIYGSMTLLLTTNKIKYLIYKLIHVVTLKKQPYYTLLQVRHLQ